MKRVSRMLSILIVASMLVAMLPIIPITANAANYDTTIVLGPRFVQGKRDFIWPVPSAHNIQSCFYDNRGDRYALHQAIDISAAEGSSIVAAYPGEVVAVYDIGRYYHDSSYGNYVVIKHNYIDKNGNTVVLYSKYNHMLYTSVSVGENVNAGAEIGKVGNTGSSQGNHLDFQIFYTSWASVSQYSIDPYSNDLMEDPTYLSPSSIYDSWACGMLYYNAIKEQYSVSLCSHEKYTDLGVCANNKCNFVFDWASTYETGSAGLYEVTKLTGIWLRTEAPYEASEHKASTKITYGKEVEVLGSVINAVGTENHRWYKVSYKGEVGYTSADNLRFKSLFAQNIYVKEKSFVPTEGATIPKAAQNLTGEIVSTYPLKQIVAYLDGKSVATWNAPNEETYVFELKKSVFDYAMPFDELPSGKHTIELKGMDIYRTSLTTFHDSYFYTETSTPEPIYYTVIYNANGGSCGTSNVSVKENTAIGTLPTPNREGYEFNGWYTAAVGGSKITANTVFTSNKTVYAQWTPVYYTVSYDTQSDSGITYDSIEVQHGYTLGELPTPTKRGYDFLGWYTAATGGTKVTSQTKVTSSMTLYAHWNPVTVIVTFDANGGTVGTAQKTVTYDQVYGDLPTPTRSGYSFVRWSREGYGTVTSDTVLEWYLDHTLVAQWAKTVYEVPGGNIYFDTTTGMITGADAKITSAEIPDTIDGASVIGVADEAFSMCTQLTNVVLPDTVRTIGCEAFLNCIRLETITLGSSVTNIGDDAFKYCYELDSITLPVTTTHIGDRAFYACYALESIAIPAGVVKIGEQTFDNCFGLTAVNVDANNTYYRSENGVLMSKDKTVLLFCPANATFTNGSYAVPAGIKTICAFAFEDCSELTHVSIPASVENIDVLAFSASLINVDSKNPHFSSIDGILFNKDQTALLRFPEIQVWSYDIPTGVAEIGDYAFAGSKLSSIYMPEGLLKIGAYAFENALSLYDINLPSTLQHIGDHAFSCYDLKRITIPENVTYIGDSAFSGCSQLTKVYFLGKLPSLDSNSFSASTACLYYKDWIDGWVTPTCNGYTTAVWESHYAVGNGYIYYDVQDGMITDCDSTVANLVIPETINGVQIVGIDSYAFSECKEIKSITIPESLRSISMFAFAGSSVEIVEFRGTVAQWLEGRVSTSYVLDSVSIQCTDKTIPADLTHVGLCSNDILWYLSEEGLLTIDGSGAIEDFASGTAPWDIFLAPVKEIVVSEGITRIGTYSFYNLGTKKITIPNSCTSIGDKAFMDCSLLQTVIIPDGVKEIGSEAFCNCSALTEITLPTSVTTLGYRAFNNSAESTTVYYAGSNSEWNAMVEGRTPSYFDEDVQIYCNGNKLPENTIYMGTAGDNVEWFLSVDGTLTITGTGPMVSDYEIRVDYAPGDWYFDYGCSWEYYDLWITKVVIEEGITSISRNAFLQHEELESVSIPASVTTVEESAFAGCAKLKNVILENGVEAIEASAFEDCSSLESITIPDSISSMGRGVFSDCAGLTTVTFIDGSLTDLPAYAFAYCESLQTVDLPNSLTNLGYLSFVGCESLKTLHIPKGVETCTLLSIGSGNGIESFSVDSNSEHLASVDGVLYNKEVKTLLLYPQAKTAESYYLPETVTTISEEAFFGNTHLKTVTIPANIYEIGDRAFFECTSLKGVYFVGRSPYYEGEDVFKKYVTDSNTNYENLPNVVIYYLQDEYYNGGWYESSYDEYKMDTWEFEVIEYRVTGGTIYFETITGRIIDADTSITAATIPAQINGWYVTSIGESAFEECTSLTSITLPNTITRIESYAFFYCYNLGSIDLPDSVSFIGSDAFSGCSSLTSIVIPEGVTEIPTWAFDYCRKLASITIPRSVKTIQYAAFEECESLNHILYRGTAEEWDMIDIVEEDNEYLLNARTLHCEVSGTELYAKKSCTYSGMCCSVCDVFVYGVMLDSDEHDFQDYVCTKCDAPKVLRYTLKENGEAVIEGLGVYWYGIEIEIPSYIEGCRVVEIADSAFVNSPIKSVVIPNTVETIGYSAFWACQSLKNVVVGSGVKTITMPSTVFDLCDKLEGIWVDPDNQYFSCDDRGALFNKDKTILFLYPEGISGDYVIENGVREIADSAFYECGKLTSVSIPASVITIGSNNFNYCDALASIWVDQANTVFSSDDFGVLFNKDKSKLIQFPRACSEKYTVPNEVVTIGEEAFSRSSTLEEVYLGNSVMLIEESAFARCSKLKAIHINEALSTVEAYAFSQCSLLADVYYEGTADQWDGIAFGTYNTNLLSATLHTGDIVIADISVKQMPQKTEYILGEEFDPTGLLLLVHYSDGSHNIISNGYTWSGFDSITIGTKSVTVNYNGCSTILEVVVRETVYDQKKGDVNGDGTVDTLDRLALSRYLANWEGYTIDDINTIGADVNSDGSIDTLDRLILSRHLANWSGYEDITNPPA